MLLINFSQIWPACGPTQLTSESFSHLPGLLLLTSFIHLPPLPTTPSGRKCTLSVRQTLLHLCPDLSSLLFDCSLSFGQVKLVLQPNWELKEHLTSHSWLPIFILHLSCLAERLPIAWLDALTMPVPLQQLDQGLPNLLLLVPFGPFPPQHKDSLIFNLNKLKLLVSKWNKYSR